MKPATSLFLFAILATTLAAPIFREKNYFDEGYVSEKYPPELIKKGFANLFFSVLANLEDETLSALDALNSKDAICFQSHPSFIFFFFTDQRYQTWKDAGCATYRSDRLDKINKIWKEFVDDMPTNLRAPYQKAYDYVASKNIRVGKDVNPSDEFLLAYLEATSQVLKLSFNERWELAFKYGELARFLIGEYSEPLANVIDPFIETYKLDIKPEEERRVSDVFPLIKNGFKTYKYGMRVLFEAKRDFLNLAKKDPKELESVHDLAEIFVNDDKEQEDYKKIGALFDLVDAYDDLCYKPHSWYQIGTHIEKWITC